MHNFSIEEKLKKKLNKIFKKDKTLYDAVSNKFKEILACSDINHYKNLRKPLQNFKRVHITSSFVLIFKYDESEDSIVFYDLDHHDSIYSQ
jgi:YafQ family addiction module toxin component